MKDSWAQLRPRQDAAAALFYDRLFEIAPQTRAYFKTDDLQHQGRKLMAIVDTAVNSLDHLDALHDALKASGQSLKAYGVRREDYDSVAAALLWTLGQGLGEGFTEPVKTAWTLTYDTIASAMMEGAGYDRADGFSQATDVRVS